MSEKFDYGGDDLFNLKSSEPQKQEEDQLVAKYRHVLFGNIGLDVLADILKICHFGCTLNPENPVQVAEYNVGIAILAKCGIFGKDTFQEVVRALSSVTPK